MTFSAQAKPRTPWSLIISIFLVSRLIIYWLGYLAYHTLPVNQVPNLATEISNYKAGMWYGILARWDTNWYLYIADHGYTGILWAFFPLYPLSVKVLGKLPLDRYLSLTLFSNFLLLGILWCLYQIASAEGEEPDTLRNILIFAGFFPLSFYFSAPYTEGLAVFLTVFSYYLAKKGAWLAAFLAAMLVGATRVTGCLSAIVLLGEFYHQYRQGKVDAVKAVGFLLVPLGALAFILFLQDKTGDPLAFLHAQKAWLRIPLWEHLTLINIPGSAVEKWFTVIYLILVAWLIWLRRWAYAAYTLLLVAIPLSTGTFMSIPRLGMNAFPVFFAGATLVTRFKFLQLPVMLISAAFLAYFTILFTLWHWVA
ncbi:MAG TPA: hypothetical protein VHQ46_05230 [Desulfobacteria bacterium]|nr:hypothetical protein [Desulfobacteria bacterium]